jgi:Ni,Fe-hydrogenase maturation factor
LHLEDADRISYKKKVLFVDASKVENLHTFQIENVKPKMDFSFTSHAISVEAILATCQTCFDQIPKVQFLTIKGYEWDLQVGLTTKAKQNLKHATEYFRQHIKLMTA